MAKREKHGPRSKHWKLKADKAWSVQIRACGRCEVCRSTNTLNAHHLINRTRPKFRHDLNNGICLCVSHHMFGKDGICAHGAQDETILFTQWLEKNVPEQYAWLMENIDDRRLPDEDFETAYLRLTDLQGLECE